MAESQAVESAEDAKALGMGETFSYLRLLSHRAAEQADAMHGR